MVLTLKIVISSAGISISFWSVIMMSIDILHWYQRAVYSLSYLIVSPKTIGQNTFPAKGSQVFTMQSWGNYSSKLWLKNAIKILHVLLQWHADLWKPIDISENNINGVRSFDS